KNNDGGAGDALGAKNPVPVLMALEVDAEGHGKHELAAHEEGGGLQGVGAVLKRRPAEEIVADGLFRGIGAQRADGVALRTAHEEARGDDRPERRALARGYHLAGELMREPFIIIVEKGDPLALSFVHAKVAGFRSADWDGEVDDAQALIGDRVQDLGGLPVVAVDDDDDRKRELSPSRNIACTHVFFPSRKSEASIRHRGVTANSTE